MTSTLHLVGGIHGLTQAMSSPLVRRYSQRYCLSSWEALPLNQPTYVNWMRVCIPI